MDTKRQHDDTLSKRENKIISPEDVYPPEVLDGSPEFQHYEAGPPPYQAGPPPYQAGPPPYRAGFPY